MSKIFLIIFCFLAIFYFLFGNKLNKKNKRNLIIFFIVVIGLLLIFTGRLNFLPAALLPALLFFRRITGLLNIINLFTRSSFGKNFKPSFSSNYLSFVVNLQTKLVEIKITNGSFINRSYASLSENEKNTLMEELEKNDLKGYKLIKMILSQSRFSQNTSSENYDFTVNNAYSILGLSQGASNEDIKKAYYNLMKKFHPDKDGNNYLANLITEAKNKLLNK